MPELSRGRILEILDVSSTACSIARKAQKHHKSLRGANFYAEKFRGAQEALIRLEHELLDASIRGSP